MIFQPVQVLLSLLTTIGNTKYSDSISFDERICKRRINHFPEQGKRSFLILNIYNANEKLCLQGKSSLLGKFMDKWVFLFTQIKMVI